MKITIEMPLEPYDLMLRSCKQSSKEFRILKSGCIDGRPDGDRAGRIMQILCDEEQMRAILNLADRVCPHAVPAIRTIIGARRSH